MVPLYVDVRASCSHVNMYIEKRAHPPVLSSVTPSFFLFALFGHATCSLAILAENRR